MEWQINQMTHNTFLAIKEDTRVVRPFLVLINKIATDGGGGEVDGRSWIPPFVLPHMNGDRYPKIEIIQIHSYNIVNPFLHHLPKTRVVYRFGIFGRYSVGISRYLPYRYRRKIRSVHFGIKKGAVPPFLLKRGAMAPFLRIHPLLD